MVWGELLTEKGEHEDAIISYPQLIGVFKVISGHNVFILWWKKKNPTRVNTKKKQSFFKRPDINLRWTFSSKVNDL